MDPAHWSENGHIRKSKITKKGLKMAIFGVFFEILLKIRPDGILGTSLINWASDETHFPPLFATYAQNKQRQPFFSDFAKFRGYFGSNFNKMATF